MSFRGKENRDAGMQGWKSGSNIPACQAKSDFFRFQFFTSAKQQTYENTFSVQ